MAKRRKKRKRWKAFLRLVLAVALLAGAGTLVVTKVFTVEKMEIVGSEYYSDEAISEWLLDDEYSWNSLYVFFKYKFVEPREMPFVDSMDVSMKSPHVLQVQVHEKLLLGRVYIKALGQSAYFDKDGFVVEMSSEKIKKSPVSPALSWIRLCSMRSFPSRKSMC